MAANIAAGGIWNQNLQLSILGFPNPAQSTTATFFNQLCIFFPHMSNAIAAHILAQAPMGLTIDAWDPQEATTQGMVTNTGQPFPYDRGPRDWHWVNFGGLDMGVRMLINSSDNAYDHFVPALLRTRMFRFPRMRDLRNFLGHLRDYALRRELPANHFLLMLQRVAIHRPRGAYAEPALNLLEKCTNVRRLSLFYCLSCLNSRSGPGRVNSKRVMKKWRNLRWPLPPIGTYPRVLAPKRARSRLKCDACRVVQANRGADPTLPQAVIAPHFTPPTDTSFRNCVSSVPHQQLDTTLFF